LIFGRVTFVRFAAFVFGCLALAGNAVAAEPTLDINVVLPQTGGAAFLGAGMSQGLQLLEKSVNASGGIAGRTLKFVILDDATSAQTAVQLMNGALASRPAVVVDGGPAATCRATEALVPTGPVLYCLTPSIHPTPGSYVFSTFFSSDDILSVSIRYLRDRGIRKIAVLNGTDATGQDADAILSTIVKQPENVKAGVTFVAYEHYNLTDLSVNAQISRIKAAGAQAVIAFTTGTALGTVLRSVADVGLNVPIVTSPGNMAYTQMESLKAVMPAELLFAGPPMFVPAQIADPGVKKAVEGITSAYKAAGAPRPDLFGGMAWDAMNMVIASLRKNGADAPASKLRDDLLATRNYAGVLGRYDFAAHPQRGLGTSSAIVERWDPQADLFVAVSVPGGAPLKR
jgi:branched-chain amino acid transport system substrate-binding protein